MSSTMPGEKPTRRDGLDYPEWVLETQGLLTTIQTLESQAHRLGFVKTARALNKAKNDLGWEYADRLAKRTAKVRSRRAKVEGEIAVLKEISQRLG